MVFSFVGSVYANGVSPHIRLEASVDSGASYHNYGGHENAGGETVTAHPGDTIKIRFKAWNSGSVLMGKVDGNFLITNGSYVDSTITNASLNMDENSQSYDLAYFDGTAGAGMLDYGLAIDGDELQCTQGAQGACELGSVDIKLKDSFPTGETVITIEGRMTKYHEGQPVQNHPKIFAFAEKAYADGREVVMNDIYSNVRISVNVVAPAPVPQVLPKTGADLSDIPMGLWQKVYDEFNAIVSAIKQRL